jgi:glycosyltransferase involved in cell wall biosynthesis
MVIVDNHERFLVQALERVFARRVNVEFEIIIVEDCSADGAREVLNSLRRRYPARMMPLFREHNMAAMRNLQDTPACYGQNIASLEGDDFWTCDDKLQRQIDFLDANPDCAISCQRARFLDALRRIPLLLIPPATSERPGGCGPGGAGKLRSAVIEPLQHRRLLKRSNQSGSISGSG